MAGTYKTPGRARLLRFLQNHPDRQFSADELAVELAAETAFVPASVQTARSGHSVRDHRASSSKGTPVEKTSKSTLYRHLSELCREGSVRKYRSDTQSAYVYQYVGQGDCCHHFHLKCVECGALVHLECAVSEALLSHIRSDHGFRVDSGRSILYGMCEACAAHECAAHECECAAHECECAAPSDAESREKKQTATHPCGCPRCHH